MIVERIIMQILAVAWSVFKGERFGIDIIPSCILLRHERGVNDPADLTTSQPPIANIPGMMRAIKRVEIDLIWDA